MMTTAAIGFTIEVIGKLMVAFTAIMVHHRMLSEHRIDKRVFRTMKREQVVGVSGAIFIIIGYFMQARELQLQREQLEEQRQDTIQARIVAEQQAQALVRQAKIAEQQFEPIFFWECLGFMSGTESPFP